jgi:GTPase SAR1 family protein
MAKQITVTMIGAEGVGKTTLLATMYKELNSIKSKFSIVAKNDTGNLLAKAFQTIKETIKAQELHTEIIPFMPGTAGINEYRFECLFKSKREFDFVFYDTKGGLLSSEDSDKEFKKFKVRLKQSQVIINVIDGAAYVAGSRLMADEVNLPTRVGEILSPILRDEEPRLILFVITKCEKWLDEGEETQLLESFEERHANVLNLINNNRWTRGLFLPVKTLGCYRFNYVTRKGDDDEKLVFHRVNHEFKPEKIEQPLCEAFKFALGHYHRNRSPLNKIIQGISGRKKAFEESRKELTCGDPYKIYRKT